MAMESQGKQQGLLTQAGNEMIIPCRWSGCQGVADLEWLVTFPPGERRASSVSGDSGAPQGSILCTCTDEIIV